MPKKISITIILTVVLAAFALFAATPAVAGSVGCTDTYPCTGFAQDFEGFLEGECGDFFNPVGGSYADICEEITTFPSDKILKITAIEVEAANRNIVTPENPDEDILFDTDITDPDYCFYNWGLWLEFNFGLYNLKFTDLGTSGNELESAILDTMPSDVRVCKLKQPSNPLTYLPVNQQISLPAGAYIIGYDDASGDNDFTDIMLAAIPVVEPEPAEPVARSKAFKTKTVDFELLLDVKGNSYDAVCPTCSVPVATFQKLADLPTFDEGELEHVPYDLPWGASLSPGCVYVRTRSGGVKKVCP